MMRKFCLLRAQAAPCSGAISPHRGRESRSSDEGVYPSALKGPEPPKGVPLDEMMDAGWCGGHAPCVGVPYNYDTDGCGASIATGGSASWSMRSSSTAPSSPRGAPPSLRGSSRGSTPRAADAADAPLPLDVPDWRVEGAFCQRKHPGNLDIYLAAAQPTEEAPPAAPRGWLARVFGRRAKPQPRLLMPAADAAPVIAELVTAVQAWQAGGRASLDIRPGTFRIYQAGHVGLRDDHHVTCGPDMLCEGGYVGDYAGGCAFGRGHSDYGAPELAVCGGGYSRFLRGYANFVSTHRVGKALAAWGLLPAVARRDGRKGDVWSLGATIAEVLLPFDYVHGALLPAARAGRWAPPPCLAAHPRLADLLGRMLARDPRKRPGMAAVAAHPYFERAGLAGVARRGAPGAPRVLLNLVGRAKRFWAESGRGPFDHLHENAPSKRVFCGGPADAGPAPPPPRGHPGFPRPPSAE